MPQAEVGMSVMVDMAGLNHGGVSMGTGARAGGVITAINPDGTITVKLGLAIGGADTVIVSPDRVAASG